MEYRNISCPKRGFEPRVLYRPDCSLVTILCLPKLSGLFKILAEKIPLKIHLDGKETLAWLHFVNNINRKTQAFLYTSGRIRIHNSSVRVTDVPPSDRDSTPFGLSGESPPLINCLILWNIFCPLFKTSTGRRDPKISVRRPAVLCMKIAIHRDTQFLIFCHVPDSKQPSECYFPLP